MKGIRFATLAVLACLAVQASAERIRLTPTDQAARDPALLSFRTNLLASIAARDTKAVLASACPDIYLSHGGNGGLDEFRQYLTMPAEMLSDEYRDQAGAMREEYWQALENTLDRPGYFDGEDQFWVPYHWQIDVPDGMDSYSAFFVDGTQVLMRAGPSRSEPPVDRLSHELVMVEEYDVDSPYQKIRLGDGRTGYMHADYLYSMVGYRAMFTKGGDEIWLLCIFVGGD